MPSSPSAHLTSLNADPMTTPRILLTRRWPEVVEARLRQSYSVTVADDDRPLSATSLACAMSDYDALCPTVTDRLGAEMFASSSRVRIIANYGAGVDHINLLSARAAGVVVTNTPDVLTEATAELAMLLILAVSRRAGEGARELCDGNWTGWRPTHLIGQGLGGRTLGLVGFGRIAQATAQRARRGFGMSIAYYSRRPAGPVVEDEFNARRCHTLDELVALSDVVSLHCPGGPETRHLINATVLAAMRPGSILVNTARGSVVDETALAAALQAGHLAGAGLDVFENEPRVSADLLACPNTVLLPHLGSATSNTRIAMGMKAADNLDRFFAGSPLLDQVV